MAIEWQTFDNGEGAWLMDKHRPLQAVATVGGWDASLSGGRHALGPRSVNDAKSAALAALRDMIAAAAAELGGTVRWADDASDEPTTTGGEHGHD